MKRTITTLDALMNIDRITAEDFRVLRDAVRIVAAEIVAAQIREAVGA